MFLLISKTVWDCKRILRISIHLMFLLIAEVNKNDCDAEHFNTSHVSINLSLMLCSFLCLLFQYISCFY